MSSDPVSSTVREIAASDPDRLVLVWAGSSLTYAQLNAEADALAHRLCDVDSQQIGVRFSDARGLMATALAVSRTGKTVLGLDPTAPADRVRAMLKDGEASLVLTDSEEDLGVEAWGPHTWVGAADAEPIDLPRPPGSPVCLVYTSGSTGTPKAIMVGEAFLDLNLRWFQALIPDTTGIRLALPTAGSSAAFVSMHRLVLGAGITLYPYEVRSIGFTAFRDALIEDQITNVVVLPTLLRYFAASIEPGTVFPHVRRVHSYGESLQGADVRAIQPHLRPDAIITNVFGMTEAGLVASYDMRADEPVPDGLLPVGHLADGVEVTIVDADGAPVPAGTAGEIVVTAHSVSHGYWRRPELDAATYTRHSDGRISVKTGDEGVFDKAGLLHHRGRLDDLVKVAGNRIALGEIEAALAALPGVHSAVASARADASGTVRLLAFVSPKAGHDLDTRALRQSLAHRLPPYMLPDDIGVLAEIPMLPNGKADRKGLPEAIAPRPSNGKLAPGLEAQIGALFSRVLERPTIGPDDDFFALGGDSLRAAELFAALAAELGHDRPLSVLLEAPTPASLAAVLQHTQPDILVAVRPQGSRHPLFVVHGGKGAAMWTGNLAPHIDEDRPIYALTAPALDGLWPQERSIDELAERYVAAVRQVQPEGPYHLFGFSLGGAIALAMAHQLRDAGDEVAFLAIGDTPLDLRQRAQSREVNAGSIKVRPVALAKRTVHHVKWRLRLLESQKQSAAWHAQLEASKHGTPVPFERRGDFVEATYGQLLRSYAPGPWPDPLTLIQPERPGSTVQEWTRVAPRTRLVTMPGGHYDMVRENSEALARLLNDELAATRQEASPAS